MSDIQQTNTELPYIAQSQKSLYEKKTFLQENAIHLHICQAN